MRLIYVLSLILITNMAYADSSSLNLALPSVPGNYQSDGFRDGDLDCKNAIGSATNLEFGVTGLIDRNQTGIGLNSGPSTDVGVYARITIPLGRRVKQRINCNRLFELATADKVMQKLRTVGVNTD